MDLRGGADGPGGELGALIARLLFCTKKYRWQLVATCIFSCDFV